MLVFPMRRMLCAAIAFIGSITPASVAQSPRFEIAFSKGAHAAPITGRVYVALSRTSDAQRGPIQQTGETGVPLFGVNVENLAAGKAAVIDAGTFGYPARSLRTSPLASTGCNRS